MSNSLVTPEVKSVNAALSAFRKACDSGAVEATAKAFAADLEPATGPRFEWYATCDGHVYGGKGSDILASDSLMDCAKEIAEQEINLPEGYDSLTITVRRIRK